MDYRSRHVYIVEFVDPSHIFVQLIFCFVHYDRLFVVGWFEEDRLEYPKLAWLVDCDLVRLIWSPSYTSEERQRTEEASPLITTYRLLVSGTAFIFGMVKAYLSYIGHGGAANVFDWTFGVVITST